VDVPADPTRRFSERVEDYARYRPKYPPDLIPLLQAEIGLSPGWRIADVGSGTGLSAELFLALGCEVFGVEPNDEMRAAAEASLRNRPFRSVAGRAEATTLPPGSVDLAFAGQAFHWFEVGQARREFSRILRSPKRVALVWNTRKLDGDPFLREYEELLLRFGTDYDRVRHDKRRQRLLAGFFAHGFSQRELPNHQELDRDGLRGRLLSSSYTPGESDPARAAMLSELDAIFSRHEARGQVHLEYETEIYCGHL
jgi:SAM-dependent methyltransferase